MITLFLLSPFPPLGLFLLTLTRHTLTFYNMLPQQENLPQARKLALEALRDGDLRERARRSGGRYEIGPDHQPRIGLRYLNRDGWISFPAGAIEFPDGRGPVSLREEILIFHYLKTAGGTRLSGEWISFANIPAGAFYNPVFQKRCKDPLVRFFGANPDDLRSVAAAMNAEPVAIGDGGFKIPAFPMTPLALVLWRGDEDFPPEGNVLFDRSITDYLPVEDIVILAETVVWKLIKTGERLKAQ